MYTAFRIWNCYLLAREPRNRAEACDRFMDKMSHFTMTFQQRSPLQFNGDTGRPQPFHISSRIFGSVPAAETRLDLWYPDNRRTTECVAAYTTFYPLITYYLNQLNDWGLCSENVKSADVSSLQKASGTNCAATSAERSRRFKTRGSLTKGQGKTITIFSIKMSVRTGSTRQKGKQVSRLTGWKKC